MKYLEILFVSLFLLSLPVSKTNAQAICKSVEASGDSTNLPPIKIIANPSSYGPYLLNTQHTNVYFITDFPKKTSKVIIKYTDPQGNQLGDSKIKEGSNIDVVEWAVQAEDIGFVLSSHLNIEVHYQSDSVAIYDMPYIVYPDTVKFFASSGWGPFISNNYPLTAGWQPTSDTSNTFKVKNLPPRTDTMEIQILVNDTVPLDSLWVYAPGGEYLDSAVFENIRMDSLPLSNCLLSVKIFCDGGPDDGLLFHKKISIIPQKPKLISITADSTLIDSIAPFTQDQVFGNALQVDSTKYCKISNGPGMRALDNNLRVIYRGPYCFDLFQGSYSIESWLKFDLKKAHVPYNAMSIMSVDSVWEFRFDSYGSEVWFSIRALVDAPGNYIFTAKIPFEDLAKSEWHHVAVSSSYTGYGYPQIHFYFDGEEWGNTKFYAENFDYIRQYVNYYGFMGTQPLFLGVNPDLYPVLMQSCITAMDEVRLWGGALSAKEVKNNFRKKILQKDWLVGYWNFDDLRNRLGFASDLSYKNNRGQLKNGAAFTPQNPIWETSFDSIIYQSSNTLADSVIYTFTDVNNQTVYSDSSVLQNARDTLLLNLSSLNYNTNKLSIAEFSPSCPDSGFVHHYPIKCFAPVPIATPRYNWNTFFSNASNDMGELYNSIIVSGMVDKVTKVELGLIKGDELYNVDSFTQNSIPYRYSLFLNGDDNYITTDNKIQAPDSYTLSLWFKTTSVEGGELIGFESSKRFWQPNQTDRSIILRKDGSLRFYIGTYILSAVNKYNDGQWHNVAVDVDGSNGASLYVDGSLVDNNPQAHGNSFSGRWIMGKNTMKKLLVKDEDRIAGYLQTAICEVIITDKAKGKNWINANRFGLTDTRSTTSHYKFNEGEGTLIHDYSGNNNGILKGSKGRWFSADAISVVVWNHNILDKLPGDYDFFAKVFYVDGSADGVTYKLGRIHIAKPFGTYSDFDFAYSLSNGFGYFNEGTALGNDLNFNIEYTGSGISNDKKLYLNCKLLGPDHTVFSSNTISFNSYKGQGSLHFDMGEAMPGSYLSIEATYHTPDASSYSISQTSFPIYINPMLKPVISGNFGPFEQAIAPGSMPQPNTFIVSTEIISDLDKVVAEFYNKDNVKLNNTEAVKINDTTWHITYEMGKLSPPITQMLVKYYLGQDSKPALIEGPYPIIINKIRPKWFDFIADTSFHDVHQEGNKVTFVINTPLHQSKLAHFFSGITIPDWVPLFGGTSSELKSPNVEAHLKWDIPQHKLELNQPPEFSQAEIEIGGGNAKYLEFDFNESQDNSYSIDDKNNLIATTNFKEGGTITKTVINIEEVSSKVEKLMALSNVLSTASIVVKPSFQLRGKGSYEYASRLHLEVDTTTGKWGSFGNLNINADPASGEAYENSASYSFYSGALGIEFDIGAEMLEGLVSGYFGIDGRLVTGLGKSYITIPNNQDEYLFAGALQIYGKFFIELLYGWYEKTIWGPKMFYSANIYTDDMSHCFPPLSKKDNIESGFKVNSSWQELSETVKPVKTFTKMPNPIPEPKITSSEGYNLISWVERGNIYGEKKLNACLFNNASASFSEVVEVKKNNHALNNHASKGINHNLSFYTWAQTRFDNKSILKVRSKDVLTDFVKAQDIWYSIYDIENDSLLLEGFIKDDTSSNTSGRAEANPVLAVLSESQVIISWQVADLESHKSELWYAVLEKTSDRWNASSPKVLTPINGVATQLEITPVNNGENAVITWLNTNKDGDNKVMTAVYDGSQWGAPVSLLDEKYNYYNYLSLKIRHDKGGLLAATFVEDSLHHTYEKLLFLPWDAIAGEWLSGEPDVLLVDSINHLQLPEIAINDNGKIAIAIKLEELVGKDELHKISQVDLFTGYLDNLSQIKHIVANEYVCDTTKQLADLQISFVNNDTLLLLSNEYPMFPTNTRFQPQNGILFGDPYMNLVLRSFTVDDDGGLNNVNENDYFTSLPEYPDNNAGIKLYQNFPNPSSENTTITFDIPERLSVKLELFDITGNKVAILLQHQLSAGRYQQQLNTSLLKTGTYIYRLTAGNTTKSLRMIVSD